MKHYSNSSVVALTLALCLASAMGSKVTDLGEWIYKPTVHVMNGLKPGTRILSAQCKSGDNDLGFRQLTVGHEFNWSFVLNFWGSTLFYCDFWWNFKHTDGVVFGAPEQQQEPQQIYYKAAEQGIYKSYNKSDWVLKFPWDH